MSQSKSAGGKDRYARWHVDEAVEQDSENWLLSYLDRSRCCWPCWW